MGAALAGFMTTVLPLMSAGASFQAGMATGKFQGVIRPTMPSGSRTRIEQRAAELRRRGLAAQPPALAGEVIEDLHGAGGLALGLDQGLAFLAGQLLGDALDVGLDDAGGPGQDIAALGRAGGPPLSSGRLGGGDRGLGVLGRGSLEMADHVVGVGRVDIGEGLAGGGIDPLASDEVLDRVSVM